MQVFSADAIMFSKKIQKNFDPENMKNKNPPSKVAYNRPATFSVLARLPKRLKNKNPVPPEAPGLGI